MKKEELSKFKINEFKYPVYGNALEKKGLLGYYENYKYEENNITVTARGNLGVALLRKKPFNAVGRLIILIPKTELNSYYVTQYINSKFKIYVESTGVPQLTAPSFRLNKIKIPKLNEQNKIANFLSAIDKKIELMEKKHTLYQNIKKYLLKNLFAHSHVPPIKKNVPELRFPEFKGEYFSTKLEHISDICGGKRLPKGYSLTSTKNNHPYITISDMNKHTVLLDNIKYVPNEIVKKIEKYVIFDSDLYITVAGTIGIVGKIPSTLNGANLTENADKITNIQINQNYLLYYLNTGALKKLIEKNRTDNAQPKLALKEIRKMSIIFPSDEEQEKIANFLSAIDKKIELMEEKLNHLKQFKKGLLQKMFC